MDLATILRIVNVLLLVIIAVLLYVNRKAKNQRLPRLASHSFNNVHIAIHVFQIA